jgi:hypothetical protein
VAQTIRIDVPHTSLGDDLTAALGARGLRAERVDDGDSCALHVSYTTRERDRLVHDATHAIELWLAERGLPLVVQSADSGAVLRPPGD